MSINSNPRLNDLIANLESRKLWKIYFFIFIIKSSNRLIFFSINFKHTYGARGFFFEVGKNAQRFQINGRYFYIFFDRWFEIAERSLPPWKKNSSGTQGILNKKLSHAKTFMP